MIFDKIAGIASGRKPMNPRREGRTIRFGIYLAQMRALVPWGRWVPDVARNCAVTNSYPRKQLSGRQREI